MITHNVEQGSAEWLALRLQNFTASEASAMLGMSKYMTRTQLLDLKKTGIAKPVNASTQMLFDKGHATEEAIRPVVEELIGEDLYPLTGSLDNGNLLASFDGLSLDFDTIFEHKLYNKAIVEGLSQGLIPEQHKPQLEQQMLVSGGTRAIFVCSDGTAENMHHAWYESEPELREKIIAGWAQFEKDLVSHEPKAAEVAVIGTEADALPLIQYQIEGNKLVSNIGFCLETITVRAKEAMATILESDQDFADKDKLNKAVKDSRARLKTVVAQAKGEFLSFSEFAETAAEIDAVLQKMQAHGEKQVKQAKDQKKADIFNTATQALNEVVASTEARIFPCAVAGSYAYPDFTAATKGKRTIESIQNAFDGELATAKIAIKAIEDRALCNLQILEGYADEYRFLFTDLATLLNKDSEDFAAIMKQRIGDQQALEERKLAEQREKIRAEEEVRARQKIEREARENAKKMQEDRIAGELAAAEQKARLANLAAEQAPVMDALHETLEDVFPEDRAPLTKQAQIAEQIAPSPGRPEPLPTAAPSQPETVTTAPLTLAEKLPNMPPQLRPWMLKYTIPTAAILELMEILETIEQPQRKIA
jgi:predicted phage-related endonuclease